MKSDTYTKLYVHIVFTPKGRESILSKSLNEKVFKYIYGIIKGKNCFPVIINGIPDHIHILIGFNPEISISDLVRDIKRSSSIFINQELKSYLKFNWQEGYGAFTVDYRHLDNVFQYILKQEEHHSNKRFKEEYIELLQKEGVEYNERYLFEFYD
jgi:putative transposase